MALSAELNKRIIEFLTSIPNINDNNVQHALILSVALDPELQRQINFSGSSLQFFQLLVSTLQDYGRLSDGRDALEALLNAAKDLVGQDKKWHCDELIQEIRTSSYTIPQSFDLLIVDDTDRWQKLVFKIFEDLYNCDVAISYEIALEKIHKNNYKIVCTNWNIGNEKIRYSDKGWKWLNFLRDRHPEIPIVLITGDIKLLAGDLEKNLQNLRNNYTNIKRIIIKGQTADFVNALEQTVVQLMRDEIPNFFSQDELTFEDSKGGIMILELLTAETIKAGLKFLFDQLGKTTDRVNNQQLAKIQEKANAAKTTEEVVAVQRLMTDIVCDPKLLSLDAFVEWGKNQITANFEDLPGLGKLIIKVLEEKRNAEQNSLRKDKFLNMISALQVDIKAFEDAMELGDGDAEGKRKLVKRVRLALDLIAK